MPQFMRVDQELIDLAKELKVVLEKDFGGRYSQAEALKHAAKKVLLK